MSSMISEECNDVRREGYIPDELRHLKIGKLTKKGEIWRGVTIFKVPVGGGEEYVQQVPKEKAENVKKITRDYVRDMEEEYPQELWTIDAPILFATSNHILVEDMHAGRDCGYGGARRRMHSGSKSGGHCYRLRTRRRSQRYITNSGADKGEVQEE